MEKKGKANSILATSLTRYSEINLMSASKLNNSMIIPVLEIRPK